MRSLPILFSLTLFGSALLSFSVQPILGKMMLPVVGGSPSGWIVALAFFQLALLAGYGVSYVLGRFSPWVHAGALLALYGAGAFFLPPHLPDIAFDGSENLAIAVTTGLFQTIFMPFLALTATTAALQRVFAATQHGTAHDPYYLFVASNAGSFIGLFAYPFVLEPFSGLSWQAQLWRIIYGVVIVLIVASCALAWRYRAKHTAEEKKNKAGEKITIKQIAWWIILSFIPCSLSMGVTTLITTDVGGLPLFWVIPLGLYLLTFILAFARKPLVSQSTLNFCHVLAAIFIVITLGLGREYEPNSALLIFLLLSLSMLSVFFIIAWACHQRLASMRPNVEHLALYFFIIALGGGLAGITHVFVIPFVLKHVIEFPAMVLLSLLIVPKQIIKGKERLSNRTVYGAVAIMLVIGVVAIMLGSMLRSQDMQLQRGILIIVLLIVTAMLTYKPRSLALLGAFALIMTLSSYYPGHVLLMKRNFFGVHAVYETKKSGRTIRYLSHGNTLHGLEITDGAQGDEAVSNSYYSQKGQIADVLDITQAKSWGIIGLGSGQLACYRSGMTTDFYEIDPDIEDAARTYFSYLTRCPPRNVIIGDGRLQVQESEHVYDVLMLDAFTSDGIPIHLITKEAVQSYVPKMQKKGMMLLHISNRFMDLAAPVAAVFQANNLTTYIKTYAPDKARIFELPSIWLAVPLDPAMGTALTRRGWKTVIPSENIWTDEQSSLLTAIKEPELKLY